jgi:hypothetical protein
MAFVYKLEHEDGTPADPPSIRSAPGVTWSAGDMIPLGRDRMLRVTEVQPAKKTDEEPVLVVKSA